MREEIKAKRRLIFLFSKQNFDGLLNISKIKLLNFKIVTNPYEISTKLEKLNFQIIKFKVF